MGTYCCEKKNKDDASTAADRSGVLMQRFQNQLFIKETTMRYATRNRRKLTFETLMEMPSEPESQAFYTYTEGDDKIEVLNDTFTLVLSRDVRKNSRIAAEMALAIAKENADHDVFYVNTYAGMALMKEAFSKALDKSGMAPLQPPPSPRLEKAGEYIEKAGESSEKAGENWANVGGGKAGESSEK
ncbi:MAG TPA: hypothetical protein VGM92_05700, partial [Candidatus Kapabacteria bacterium]